MRSLKLIAVSIIAVVAVMSCNKDENAKDGNANGSSRGIIVTMPDWVMTKSYSRTDLTIPEMNIGEKVAVIDEQGQVLCFNVVESEDSTAVLDNPDVELMPGASYRIQYPYPDVTDSQFMMSLGFGDYECTPSLDWMISNWKVYEGDQENIFDLRRINSVLIFDVVAPFDCVVEEMRISCDKCQFCIKGAFDCRGNELVPDRTTWVSEFQFPQRMMTWVAGEKYTLILTLWPYDYSAGNCTFDIYTTDDRGASAPISIPEMHEGEIKEYEINEFEILAPPVYKKDVREEGHVGDEVVSSCYHPGELY